MNFPTGSEWRKWNLHIHTPGTAMNDQFTGATDAEKWENYLAKLEAVPDVAVLGVTDYFSIAGYQKLKEFKEAGRIPQFALLLPNVELRIVPATGAAHAINLHVIFSPDVVGQLDSHFFQALTFSYQGNPYRCTRADLVQLGRAFAHDNHKEEGASYREGVNQFKVSYEQLRDVLAKSQKLQGKFLIAVPNGSNDGNSGLQDASLAALRQEIYRLAHLIFSGNPNDAKYFLGEGVDSPEQVMAKCGSLKPCVVGCDAHTLEQVCVPAQNRFTWIKADPTFEGLRQICFEPKERVRIQPGSPAHEFAKPYFSGVTFKKDLVIFAPDEKYGNTRFGVCPLLPLNADMVCIIGGRGTGKSCLVDYLGCAFGSLGRKPDVTYADDFVVRFNKDAANVDAHGAATATMLPFVYIGQNEVKGKIIEGKVGDEIKRMLGLEELAFDLTVETRISEVLGDVSGAEAFFQQKNEKGEVIYDKESVEGQIARYESLLASITTEQNREKLQQFTANVQKLAAFRERDRLLKEFRGELLASAERLNALIAGTGVEIPPINFDGQIAAVDRGIEDIVAAIAKCEEENRQTREDFAKIYSGDLSGLLENAESYRNTIEKLKLRLAEIERRREALAKAIAALAEIPALLDAELTRQRTAIEKTWAAVQAGRPDWNDEQRALMKKILADRQITLEAKVVFKSAVFYEKLKSAINLRYFRASASESVDAKVRAEFGITDHPSFLEFLRTGLRAALKAEYVAGDLGSVFYDLAERSQFLYVEPQITYGGRPLDRLSVGQKGTVYLCLKLATQPFSQPLVFDQPEDDLDNEFIIKELVTIFRGIKRFRQVIVVTHNANLVVNADSEQVIVASNDDGCLTYQAGSLENPATNSAIRRILEGGDEAFRKREQKYHFAPR